MRMIRFGFRADGRLFLSLRLSFAAFITNASPFFLDVCSAFTFLVLFVIVR